MSSKGRCLKGRPRFCPCSLGSGPHSHSGATAPLLPGTVGLSRCSTWSGTGASWSSPHGPRLDPWILIETQLIQNTVTLGKGEGGGIPVQVRQSAPCCPLGPAVTVQTQPHLPPGSFSLIPSSLSLWWVRGTLDAFPLHHESHPFARSPFLPADSGALVLLPRILSPREEENQKNGK